MLEHEPQSAAIGPRASSAAQTRVTAEEFTAAINSVEQKKASEAARLAGTVEIGQTIRELNIEATPEEILREVEAQRAQKVTKEQLAAETRAREAAEARERAAIAAARLKVSAQNAAAAALESFQQREEEKKARRTSRPVRNRGQRGRSFFRLFALAAVVLAIGSHKIAIPKVNIGPGGITVQTGSPVITDKSLTLSSILDGQTVYCDSTGLKKLLQSKGTSENEFILTHSAAVADSWPITRHGDQLYLEGYIFPTADNDIGSRPLHVYHDGGSIDANTTKEAVSLPIAGGTFSSGAQVSEPFHPLVALSEPPSSLVVALKHVEPDTHLHDSF